MTLSLSQAVCFHCKMPIDGEGLSVVVAGETRQVCCHGCLSAVRQIDRLHLADYYQYRDRFDKGDTEAKRDASRDASRVDRTEEILSSVASVRGGLRLSVRVPDIRCAACTWLIESSLRQREDVRRCVTNLADKRVTMEFSGTDPMELVAFIEGLGFSVLPDRVSEAQRVLDAERKSMLARLGVAGIGMMQVMMYAIATYVAGPGGIEPAYASLMHWASLAIATPIVVYSAGPFHKGAWRDLRHLTLGMDVPVSLAVLAAFGLSLVHTVRGSGDVYFDSVTMFTFLLLIGRFIETGSRRRFQSSRMLSDSLMPASALLVSGVRISATNIVAGDVLKVGPGESIPADGVITEGTTWVSEAAFTGESKPLSRGPGSRVLAGSDNLEGAITVRATVSYSDFVISMISKLYEESTSYKPRFALIADVAARYFVAFILLAASVSAVGWYMAGSPEWFSIGLAVLVVSCPCALSLATPVAYTVAVSTMRNNGLVIGNGTFLERLARVRRIIFDKTGTLTTGKPRIEHIVPLDEISTDEALDIAAALEAESHHPIARAFERATPVVAHGVRVFPGKGVAGRVGDRTYRLGKSDFASHIDIGPPRQDGTWILLSAAGKPLAWFGLADEMRPEAMDVVQSLKASFDVVMFTGDADIEARRLAGLLAIDDVSASMSPEDKVRGVRAAQARGDNVLMIGDGINDAAALAAASASISVSPADIVVQEAADATLLNADLHRIPLAIGFARRVRRVIRENIAWAVLYNIVVIPLAMAGLVAPWMAALGMSASSVLVVLNANRLHRIS